MLITSRSHAAVKRFRALRLQGADEGLCVLEGVKLIEEALGAGLEILEAVASPRALQDPRREAVVARLQGAGVSLRMVSEDILASLSGVEQDQGVVAVARRRTFPEDALFSGRPLVLVAVDVQNPGNVGALLRTAEAAGATGACLVGCADPWSWKALRGSMGSTFRLPHLRPAAAATALGLLRERGVRIYATASRDGARYDRADLRGPSALVLGNEGAGLDPALLGSAGSLLVIPMAGQAESLNVGVAAGVLLFEAARQRASGEFS